MLYTKLKAGDMFETTRPYVMFSVQFSVGSQSQKSVMALDYFDWCDQGLFYEYRAPVMFLSITNVNNRTYCAYYKLLVGEKIVYCGYDVFKKIFRKIV
jgi:hypothetical protein